MYLGTCTLPDGDDAVLAGVEHLAHLAHGLGVGGAGGEVAVPVQPAKQATPPIVPVSSIGQAPGHQRLALHQALPCQAYATIKLSTSRNVCGWQISSGMQIILIRAKESCQPHCHLLLFYVTEGLGSIRSLQA